MLADLAIKNLGVIHSTQVEFAKGLTVLTGETGAGKTMVVTSLRLLAGGRADAQRVRAGAAQAVIEARFNIDETADNVRAATQQLLEDVGGELDENGEVITQRTVSAQGRSKAYLGGRATPASNLAKFTNDVLTIHGQNDQLRLLHPEQQLAALDRFNPEISAAREHYSGLFRQWHKLAKDLAQRQEKRMELAQEVDRLEFAINEITQVDPQPDEDIALKRDIKRLQDVDALEEQANTALAAIDGAQAFGDFGGDAETLGASDLLGKALSALESGEDETLIALGRRLQDAVNIASEVAAELGGFLSGLPTEPDALESLLLRQQEIKQLTRKYAPDIAGVLQWREKAERRLAAIDTSPEVLEALKEEVQQKHDAMMAAAQELSALRLQAIEQVTAAVTEELHGLAMPKAVFGITHNSVAPQPSGIDEVEFVLAANAQAPRRPLGASASGGELSRIMLALEVILSAGTRGATLVFDEVDAGVGGRAAVEIGRRLARLAVDNQVIVVTHLPQVAAYADQHLHVVKNVGDESVTSGVQLLDKAARIEELARMLAGLDDTETGRAHAAELFEKAQSEVQSLQ